jgi:hypothetical protein
MASLSIVGGVTALAVGLRLRRFGGAGGVTTAPLMGRS